MTATSTVFPPTESNTVSAMPLAAGLPPIWSVAAASFTVAVTLSEVTENGTLTLYDVAPGAKAGLSDPSETVSARSVPSDDSPGSARVTVTV